MGLDLTLGAIILVMAFRGWCRGFISQAVWIAGLIASVYLAESVREFAKPYMLAHLPTIPPPLVDRLLWWISVVVTFIVLVGFASIVIKMTRRPEIPGIPQAGRNDQFAGFMLGASKGVLAAAVATACIQQYAMEPLKTLPWAEEQVKTSYAAKWSDDYHPVPRVWSSQPVRHFVGCIDRMGLRAPGEPAESPAGEAEKDQLAAVRTASRPADAGLSGGAGDSAEPPSAEAAPPVKPDDQAIAKLRDELKKEPKGSN